MTPENWRKVKDILAQALEIPTHERASFLEKICAGDEHLKREVESLLEFEDTRANLLDESAFSVVTEDDSGENLDSFNGREIGKYKIIRPLGAGGMGAVFLAERADGEFTQKVALKLIKRGMNSAAVLRRFFNERQILASLEHPNIAHLIDGGTIGENLPYFVMEYVEGETIIEYAERENLDLDAKLNLFLEICQAVAFAHRNLVIHRDLKPSNILVTKDGEPKLLDFGIAKLHNPESSGETATQNFVFTPEYASPEQVRGENLTTATDVYSLGAILYELLTGTRPYRTESKSIGEIMKAVCETEPERPSSVVGGRWSVVSGQWSVVDNNWSENSTAENKGQRTKDEGRPTNPKLLKGDLDNIILKALRKEPARRYSSVEQFAEDIRRHQNGLPVSATKDTWNYRAQKFIKRNSLAAAAAILIALTLLGGLAATLYQYNKAQRRFNDVRQLANSFLFEFHDAIAELPGATPARELVVKRAIEYLDKLAQESGNSVELQRELAAAYDKIGRIQGNSYYSNLGDTEGGMKNTERSLEIREKLAAADPNNRQLQFELSQSLRSLGDLQYTFDDLRKSKELYERGLKILQTISAAEPDNKEFRINLAEMYSRHGDVSGLEGYQNLGETLVALEDYRQATAINEELFRSDPENKSYQSDLSRRYSNLGMQQNTVGDSADALETGMKAIALQEKNVAANPTSTDIKLNLGAALITLRYPLMEEGKTADAIANANRVIEMLKEMQAADPENAIVRRSLGVSYNSLGICYRESNDSKKALAAHQQALKIAETLYAESPSGETSADLNITRMFLAQAQISDKDYAEALKNLRQSAEEYEKKIAAGSANRKTKEDLSTIYAGIAQSLIGANDLQAGLEYHRRALKFAEETANASPFNARSQSRLGQQYYETAQTLLKVSQSPEIRAEARTNFEQAQQVFQKLKDRNALRGTYLKNFETIPQQIARCKV